MTETKRSREEVLAELRQIGDRVREMRSKIAPDSPYAGYAFHLAAIVGELEAELSSGRADG